jgi:uncharacterized protein YndB with AHSA1/START domain
VEHEAIEIDTPLDDVFRIITTPRTYPGWLRGAHRIRDVDDDWPAVGSAFHHVVGIPPFVLADETRVAAIEAPGRLELKAKARPTGVAHVRFRLTPLGERRTRVELDEVLESGPARWLWDLGGRVVMAPLLRIRNRSSLQRLKDLAERATAVTG